MMGQDEIYPCLTANMLLDKDEGEVERGAY